jgi:hypothetical protein
VWKTPDLDFGFGLQLQPRLARPDIFNPLAAPQSGAEKDRTMLVTTTPTRARKQAAPLIPWSDAPVYFEEVRGRAIQLLLIGSNFWLFDLDGDELPTLVDRINSGKYGGLAGFSKTNLPEFIGIRDMMRDGPPNDFGRSRQSTTDEDD